MKRVFKNIIFSILAVIIFFGILEAQQRIRYYFKYKDIYYLCYGLDGVNRNIQDIIFIVRKKILRKQSSGHEGITIDCYGGSTTNNSGLYEARYTWPAYLQDMLDKGYPGKEGALALQPSPMSFVKYAGLTYPLSSLLT